MNQHKYDDQKLSDRHPFTVQQFSEEFSAILAKQIVQKGTYSEILSLLKRFVPEGEHRKLTARYEALPDV